MTMESSSGPDPVDNATPVYMELLDMREDIKNRILRRRRNRARLGASMVLLCTVGAAAIAVDRHRAPNIAVSGAGTTDARTSADVTTGMPPESTTIATVKPPAPHYRFMGYARDPQGRGRLEFHFTASVDATSVAGVADIAGAPPGQISYTRQDSLNGAVMICADQHFGLAVSSLDLLLPGEWFPSELPGLFVSEGMDEFVADGVFGKVVGCPPRNGVTQVFIALAKNPTPAQVRVEAAGDIITVTVG